MPAVIEAKLVIAVSARALFNTEDSHKILTEKGEAAYTEYMHKKRDIPFRAGVAFALIEKLLKLNSATKRDMVEVVIVSRNSAASAVRMMNSIQHYGLDIERIALTRGGDRIPYLHAFGVGLFLSANSEEVRRAITEGIPAAVLAEHCKIGEGVPNEVRIALDGDAVIFDSASEWVNKNEGLAAFHQHEKDNAKVVMGDGPMKSLLMKLVAIKAATGGIKSPLKLNLVTARGTGAFLRAVYTLIDWGVELDDACFVGGLSKAPFLAAWKADIFFDDAPRNVEEGATVCPSGHVVFGANNEIAPSIPEEGKDTTGGS